MAKQAPLYSGADPATVAADLAPLVEFTEQGLSPHALRQLVVLLHAAQQVVLVLEDGVYLRVHEAGGLQPGLVQLTRADQAPQQRTYTGVFMKFLTQIHTIPPE